MSRTQAWGDQSRRWETPLPLRGDSLTCWTTRASRCLSARHWPWTRLSASSKARYVTALCCSATHTRWQAETRCVCQGKEAPQTPSLTCLASSTTHADLSGRHRATSRACPHAEQHSLQLGACRRAVQIQLHGQVDSRGAATRQGWRQGGAALLRRPRNTSSVITGRRRCAQTPRRARRRRACCAAAATSGGAGAAHLPSRDTGPHRLLRALEEERQQDCAAHAGQRECNTLAADGQQSKGGMTRPTDAHGCCEFLHSLLR